MVTVEHPDVGKPCKEALAKNKMVTNFSGMSSFCKVDMDIQEVDAWSSRSDLWEEWRFPWP